MVFAGGQKNNISWNVLLRELCLEFYDDPNFALHLSLLILLACITIYINVHIIATRKRLFSHPWPTVPGCWPIVGHWHLIRNVKHLTNKVEAWADQWSAGHGCMDIQIFHKTYTVICRDDLAEYVIKHRVDSIGNAHSHRESLQSLGATGLLSAEGGQWRRDRQAVTPLLNKKHHIKDYMLVLGDVAQRLVQKWDEQLSYMLSNARYQNNTSLIINKDIANATADVILRIALGKDFDLLNNNNPQSRRMAKDIQIITTGATRRSMSPVAYWRLPLIGQNMDGLRSPLKRIQGVVKAAVDEEEVFMSGEETKEGKQQSTSPSTFVAKLLMSAQSLEMDFERERLTGNAMSILFGGVQPTSRTLINALYLLAQDRELQEELQQEAKSVQIGSLDVGDIYHKLPRLKSFFHEVHRCYGAAISIFQIEEELPFCGALLPRGANLILLGRYISKSKKMSTDDTVIGESGAPPSEFDPRRYLSRVQHGDSGSSCRVVCSTPRHGTTAFGGFGHEPRCCPGRNIAELFSYCLCVSLLQHFDLELAPKHPKLREIYNVVQTLHGNVSLKLTRKS